MSIVIGGILWAKNLTPRDVSNDGMAKVWEGVRDVCRSVNMIRELDIEMGRVDDF